MRVAVPAEIVDDWTGEVLLRLRIPCICVVLIGAPHHRDSRSNFSHTTAMPGVYVKGFAIDDNKVNDEFGTRLPKEKHWGRVPRSD